MKAIVCTAYGGPDVLKLEEVERPRPKAGEVLVRVHATTASRADGEIRRFEFPAWVWLPVRLAFGVVRPRVRILGQEFAGEVEALGAEATLPPGGSTAPCGPIGSPTELDECPGPPSHRCAVTRTRFSPKRLRVSAAGLSAALPPTTLDTP